MKAKRNDLIEIARFIAILFIASYHFEILWSKDVERYLEHFYIWVEFFFVLSGFFLAINALKNLGGGSRICLETDKEILPSVFFVIYFLFSD